MYFGRVAIQQLIFDDSNMQLQIIRNLPLVVLNSSLLFPTNVKPLKWVEFVALVNSDGFLLVNTPFEVPSGIADTIDRQS